MRSSLLAVLLLCASSNATAGGPLGEPHAMFFFQLPFDGAAGTEPRSSFGFRMDQVRHGPDHAIDYRRLMRQPPLLELKMNRDGISSFIVSGTDYLRLYRTLHADGGGDADTGAAAADQDRGGEASAETGETGDKGMPVAKKASLDFWDMLTTVWDKAPAGVIIGVGFGAALLAGVGG